MLVVPSDPKGRSLSGWNIFDGSFIPLSLLSVSFWQINHLFLPLRCCGQLGMQKSNLKLAEIGSSCSDRNSGWSQVISCVAFCCAVILQAGRLSGWGGNRFRAVFEFWRECIDSYSKFQEHSRSYCYEGQHGFQTWLTQTLCWNLTSHVPKQSQNLSNNMICLL